MYNKEELRGKGKQIIGRIKEMAGDIFNRPNLEAEGRLQTAEGQVQESFCRARRQAGEVLREVGKKVARQ